MKMFGVVNGIQDFKRQKRNETVNRSHFFCFDKASIDVTNKILTTHCTPFQFVKICLHAYIWLINDNIYKAFL